MRECLGSEGIQDLAQWWLTPFHSRKLKEELVRHSQGSCGGFVLFFVFFSFYPSHSYLHPQTCL